MNNIEEEMRRFAKAMDMPLHAADPETWGPAGLTPLITIDPTPQCKITYGRHRCEREDQHPLPHRVYIRTEWQ